MGARALPVSAASAALPSPNLGPFSANNSAQNIAQSAGIDVQAPVPADGRTVVYTDAQRKALRYVYPGLEVRVLFTGRKYMFARLGHPNGVAANNDAWWDDITEGAAGAGLTNGYKGSWNLDNTFPGLQIPVPSPGDFYIISENGAAPLATNGPAINWDRGDIAIYSVEDEWHRIGNYSNTLPVSITVTDIQNFSTEVQNIIAGGAVKLYNVAQSYKMGQMVAVVETFAQAPARSTMQATGGGQQDAHFQNKAVTLYMAVKDNGANSSVENADNWLMIATTNYNRLHGRLVADNTAGRLGSNAANDDGAGKYLDAKEVMRRMALAGNGVVGGTIDGGRADTPASDYA